MLVVFSAPLVSKNTDANNQTYTAPQNEPPPISADDRIANYNFWLTILTGVLAVVSVVQIFFLQRSDRTARISAEAASELTKLAVKRPWVFISGVHEFKFVPDHGDEKRETLATPQGRLFIEYIAANHGESPALVEEVCCEFMFFAEAFVPQVVQRNHQLMISPILGPGETVSIKERLPQERVKQDGSILIDLENGGEKPMPIICDNEELFFWIIVRYRGVSSAGHETSALWQYRKHAGFTFMQTGGAERNYAK